MRREMDSSGNLTLEAGGTITGNITAESGSIGGVTAGENWQDPYTMSGSMSNLTIDAGTSVGNVIAEASVGYDGAMSNVTITAEDGSIGNLTAATGIGVIANATVNIGNITTADGDITGNFTASSGNIGNVSTGNGSLAAPLSAGGSIGNITVYNDITGDITASNGNIGNITASTGNITSNITSGNGTIGDISSGLGIIGLVSASGDIGDITAAGGDITGNITSTSGNIGNITCCTDISGNITASGSIGDMMAEGEITGNITSSGDAIGSICANGDLSATISAATFVAAIWTGGNFSGTVTSHMGDIIVETWGDLHGQVTALDDVDISAGGNVGGTFTSQQEGVSIVGWGDISGIVVSAPQDIDVRALGNISGNITSRGGNIFALSMGDIHVTGSAGAAAVIDAAGHIQGSMIAPYGVNSYAGVSTTIPSYGDVTVTENDSIFEACFAKGTRVLKADGVTCCIEEVVPGDLVLAASEHDPEGIVQPRRVVEVYHNKPARIFHVELAGDVVRTTGNHPFYVQDKGWIHARDLTAGDQLRGADGRNVAITGVIDTSVTEPVFNLQIETDHTYFVSASPDGINVLVHNASDEDDDPDVIAQEVQTALDEQAQQGARQEELQRIESQEGKTAEEAESDAEQIANLRGRALARARLRGWTGQIITGDNLKDLEEAEARDLKEDREAVEKALQDAKEKVDDAIQKGLSSPKTFGSTLEGVIKGVKLRSPILRPGMSYSVWGDTTIYGTPQNTGGPVVPNPHAQTVYEEASELALSGKYKSVIMNRSLWTATGRTVPGDSQPDIVGITNDEKVDLFEVVSPSQKAADQLDKLKALRDTMPKSMQGIVETFTIPSK